MRKPYFWTRRNGWYIKSDDGKQNIFLSDDEAEAFTKWQAMRAAGSSQLDQHSVAVVLERFTTESLGSVTSHQKRLCYYLAQAATQFRACAAIDLTPKMIETWLDTRETWGPSSRRTTIHGMKRAWRWACEQGLLTKNKLVSMLAPEDECRESIISDAEHKTMCLNADPQIFNGRVRGTLRLVLIALKHTGARPVSIATVQAHHVSRDLAAWVFPKHKTRKKTKKPLVVYLSPCAQTLTKILLAARPDGHLFRNTAGKPWTGNGLAVRLARLRERLKLPGSIILYGYRHSYATNALIKEVPLATVSALLGHQSTTMVTRRYGHLDKAADHLKEAAKKVME